MGEKIDKNIHPKVMTFEELEAQRTDAAERENHRREVEE